jgi:hypothetical protein
MEGVVLTLGVTDQQHLHLWAVACSVDSTTKCHIKLTKQLFVQKNYRRKSGGLSLSKKKQERKKATSKQPKVHLQE